jgi:hypothetical protein
MVWQTRTLLGTNAHGPSQPVCSRKHKAQLLPHPHLQACTQQAYHTYQVQKHTWLYVPDTQEDRYTHRLHTHGVSHLSHTHTERQPEQQSQGLSWKRLPPSMQLELLLGWVSQAGEGLARYPSECHALADCLPSRIFFFFWVGLGFELRASCLQSRQSQSRCFTT